MLKKYRSAISCIAMAVCLLLLVSCAGFQRSCSSEWASATGADWIVVQYGYNGEPINCWKLSNTSISNEQGSDGVYWKDPSGHLVHISGWYNRIQVKGADYEKAAQLLGVDLKRIHNGRYARE